MRVAVIGSREYPFWNLVIEFVSWIPDGSVVVSGGARGVDTVAVKAAKKRGLETHVITPDQFVEAGMKRNQALRERNRVIVGSADVVVAFMIESTSGTCHALDCAMKMGKPWIIISDRLPDPV